ncbi:hypothetical protein B9T38_12185 [Acinetobacter sp. ANC 4218]|uniref:hypothetical protein n=1 Tax=Acinetobacter sp. ANC 4218 TaxID=1977880 RepID=UPI000A344056|nr:hypothetical protein [Acinetobacter sp. ANC 4218]OTG70613.1 hypothetical protein B9T38_12185 [Acinetobacter sp. ANC 4218]
MNLIEQLGGYEKAKEIVFDPLHPKMTHVSNDGRHWVNEEFSYIPEIQEQIPAMVRIEDIRKALLQYRRQHNIFENGDWVVYEITGTIGDFIDHIKLATGHPYCRVDFGLCDVGLILLKHIRHATDEEIAAGKRLEGNS